MVLVLNTELVAGINAHLEIRPGIAHQFDALAPHGRHTGTRFFIFTSILEAECAMRICGGQNFPNFCTVTIDANFVDIFVSYARFGAMLAHRVYASRDAVANLGKPPPGTDLVATRYPLLVAILSSSWALGVIAIVLRIVCRRLTKSRLWLDDWLALASMVPTAAEMAIAIFWKGKYGFGKHVWAGSPETLREWAHAQAVNKFNYILSITATKLSLLALYWRIFKIYTSIKPLIWILLGLVLAWAAGVIMMCAVNCTPFRSSWERFDPVHPMPAKDYTCHFDTKASRVAVSVPNTVTDALLVVLPIVYTQRLHLRLAQRISVFFTFAGGIFVVLASVGRAIASLHGVEVKGYDVTWCQIYEAIFGGLEVNIGTVCGCIPVMRPILNLILYGTIHAKAHAHVTPQLETIIVPERDPEMVQ